MPEMLEAGHGASARYRVDPQTVQAHELPHLMGMPEHEQRKKLAEIQLGGDLARGNPRFPERRRCRDVFWGFLFVALTVALFVGNYSAYTQLQGAASTTTTSSAPQDLLVADQPSGPDHDFAHMACAGLAGGGASLVAAMAYMWLARSAPACVLWTSLLLGPMLAVVFGVVLVAAGIDGSDGGVLVIRGVVMVVCSLLSLCFFLLLGCALVPFSIKMLEVV